MVQNICDKFGLALIRPKLSYLEQAVSEKESTCISTIQKFLTISCFKYQFLLWHKRVQEHILYSGVKNFAIFLDKSRIET